MKSLQFLVGLLLGLGLFASGSTVLAHDVGTADGLDARTAPGLPFDRPGGNNRPQTSTKDASSPSAGKPSLKPNLKTQPTFTTNPHITRVPITHRSTRSRTNSH